MRHTAAVRAAFGDQPEAPVAVHPSDPPDRRWLAAVALGARGWYAAAGSLLDGIYRERDASPAVRAHAAVTRGAHLRQLGGHQAARRWDGRGLALATQAADGGPPTAADPERAGSDPCGLDRVAARVDALLGLAADAIGLADPELAGRLLRGAQPLVVAHASWRPRVRWHWVHAELALATDRPDQAVPHARCAVQAARAAGATRHEIKSALVLAVAEAGAGRPTGEVVENLTWLSERADRTGLRTLQWPMEMLLAELTSGTDVARSEEHGRRAVRIVGDIRRRTDARARDVFDRSPWVPSSLRVGLLHSAPHHPPETAAHRNLPEWSAKFRPDRVKVDSLPADMGDEMSPGCRKQL